MVADQLLFPTNLALQSTRRHLHSQITEGNALNLATRIFQKIKFKIPLLLISAKSAKMWTGKFQMTSPQILVRKQKLSREKIDSIINMDCLK